MKWILTHLLICRSRKRCRMLPGPRGPPTWPAASCRNKRVLCALIPSPPQMPALFTVTVTAASLAPARARYEGLIDESWISLREEIGEVLRVISIIATQRFVVVDTCLWQTLRRFFNSERLEKEFHSALSNQHSLTVYGGNIRRLSALWTVVIIHPVA